MIDLKYISKSFISNIIDDTSLLNKILHGETSEHLVQLDKDENSKIYLTNATKKAFIKLQEEAKRDGLNLQIASSFRDFQRQKAIFEAKYTGKKMVLDRTENPIDISNMTDFDKVRSILIFSAIPGLSRHHWGTDLDVYTPNTIPMNEHLELTNKEYTDGHQKLLAIWLSENMTKYGFFRPYSETKENAYSSELWHISYAEESDLFTNFLNKEESLDFLENHVILGKTALKSIIESEFEQRFKIFSNKFYISTPLLQK
ncbi:MAG: M15 family metallopeptidase [Succinivibrionaceae bacterium]